MKSATKTTVSIFGVIAALAGIEHGIGEILQGNVAPKGIVILSWPESEFFSILAGEPAMTIIPNLLVTGILAVFFSLIFLVWVTAFVQRRYGGLVLVMLSIVLLLVGGGFGPPLLGVILGIAATRINAPLAWWRAHLPGGLRRFLGKLWPWSLIAGVIFWLLLLPGASILAYFFGVDNSNLVVILFFLAFGFLLLTIVAGFARDVQSRDDSPSAVLG